MKEYTFKNNAGVKKTFEAKTLFEAKELAIAFFETLLVYPCHFELKTHDNGIANIVKDEAFAIRNVRRDMSA